MANKHGFKVGHYYVLSPENRIVHHAESLYEARKFAFKSDVILGVFDPEGYSTGYYSSYFSKIDKITLDFDKKLLTIEGGNVTLNGVSYEDGATELEDAELVEWEKMVSDAYLRADEVSVVGTPPVDGKDITDEMSNL